LILKMAADIFPERAPVRSVTIARRRHLAASGAIPPSLACKFTVGELAALRIVADEVRENGHCDRTLAEIAARAGVCRSIAKNAIRTAAAMGLLTVQERRREGQKNLANLVSIVSRERQ
jgi:GTP-sensing pleiotropic transcriptional regulator CodY